MLSLFVMILLNRQYLQEESKAKKNLDINVSSWTLYSMKPHVCATSFFPHFYCASKLLKWSFQQDSSINLGINVLVFTHTQFPFYTDFSTSVVASSNHSFLIAHKMGLWFKKQHIIKALQRYGRMCWVRESAQV